jgi:collagen type VII alpha
MSMGGKQRDPSGAQRARDAALGRLSRARRWVFAGAAALTAGFAGLVAAVAPGRTVHSTTTPAPTTGRASSAKNPGQLPPRASPSQLGLQGPAQAPTPSGSSGATGSSSATGSSGGTTGSSGGATGSSGVATGSSGTPAAPSQSAPASAPAPVSGGS